MGRLRTPGRPRDDALGGRRVLLRRNVRPPAGGRSPRAVPHVHRHVGAAGAHPRRSWPHGRSGLPRQPIGLHRGRSPARDGSTPVPGYGGCRGGRGAGRVVPAGQPSRGRRHAVRGHVHHLSNPSGTAQLVRLACRVHPVAPMARRPDGAGRTMTTPPLADPPPSRTPADVARRIPVTLGLLAVLLLTAGTGLSDGSLPAVGAGAREPWWRLLTSAIWCSDASAYAGTALVCLLLVGPAERRLGSRL